MLGGETLSIETGKLAKQADGSVVVRYGDTMVLVTAVAANSPRVGADFLPLTVDYREATYAGGRIPGGFFKREGRSNEKETLTCRVIDRSLRPLFPDGWNFETQIIGMVLSSDQNYDSDVLALTGASFALGISDIPFHTPIGAVRVGIDPEGNYLINPSFEQRAESSLDLVLAGTEEAIVMVEAGAREVQEDKMIGALEYGHAAIREIIEVQKRMISEIGKTNRPDPVPYTNDSLCETLSKDYKARLADTMRIKGKLKSYAASADLKGEMKQSIAEASPEDQSLASHYWHDMQDEILREEILNVGKRLDGRDFDEIRDIHCEVGLLPRTHGSSVFTRGETQALAAVTLGTSADTQRLDWLEGATERRFMLHYNFPPFSVGEARFLRGPGRREIGHGALAERALLPMMPTEEEWPYVIRVVSEILESNGSSSMATICSGVMAMQDAGVPIKKPVAGIAMGLVKAGETFAVMTDIAGAEDHHGDMDFKVAGTADGITALQMDIKIGGIDNEILDRALSQARDARLHILGKMREAIETPRDDVSQYAPRILTIQIDKDKIRDIIGPGGKTIRSIVERTGCKIEVQDDGRVHVASIDEASAQKALDIIRELTAEAELGKTYMGKVVRVVPFGAFVEILPAVEGLLHISEIDEGHVDEVSDYLNDGDEVMVKVIEIDPTGRVRLSRRAVLREKRGETDDSGSRGSDSGGGRGGRGGDRGGRGGRGGDRGGRGGDRGGRGDQGPQGGSRTVIKREKPVGESN
jgi:polyribonucleotide nucleotidyltransferase